MTKINRIISLALFSAMLFLTCSFCTNKEQTSNGTVHSRTYNIRSDHQRSNEIKKGVDESRKILVARVNGADITMYSLIKEMNAVAPTFIPDGVPATPEITLKIRKKALNNLIFRELAVQEAIRQGIRVEPEEVEGVIKKIRTQAGSEDAYKKYLEERNFDEAALKEMIERSRLFETITARQIFDRIRVDEEAIRDRYLKEKASFVSKVSPPQQPPFEEAKDSILKRIKAERGEIMLEQWDKKLREKAKIDIL